MSQTARHNPDSVTEEMLVSEWFLKNYPNTSLGEMANYYREMRTEVPLLAVHETSYGLFYGRMTGHTTLADVAARKSAARTETAVPQTLSPLLPVAALLSLIVLSAVGFMMYIGQ